MRTAYVALAGLMLLNVVFQFVAAGTGLVELGGDGEFDPHRAGAGAAHLWPLLMIIVAAVGKLGRVLIITPIVLLLLITFQYATAENIGAIHPLVGLIIAFGTYHALMAARRRPDAPRSDSAAA
jgi:hypothetical protein